MSWYENNKEKHAARRERWRKANPEKKRAMDAAWRAANPAKLRESRDKWRLAHPLEQAAAVARWQRANPGKVAARAGKRRAAKLRATPLWANQFFIDEAYDLASRRTAATGFPWHVDHIVPLQSKSVCGLHVENNLRVIPARLNQIKGSRMWPGMPQQKEGVSRV